MSDFVTKLLHMGLTASWFILAVCLLRLLLGNKVPRKLFPLLWGVAGLRLLCPFSIQSSLSLVPRAKPGLIQAGTAAQLVPEDGFIVFPTNPPIPIENPSLVVETVPGTNWTGLLAWIWLAGFILLLCWAVFSWARLQRKVDAAVLLRDNIYQSERVESPFVLGLFRPKIYLPFRMEEGDLPLVLAHEQAHIKRRDHWWKPLGFLVLALYWFHPLVWLAYILLCRDIELACDEKVVAELDRQQRADYSQALLRSSMPRHIRVACPLAFGEVGVKERVRRVLNYKKPAFWVLILALAACGAAGVFFLTDPKSEEPQAMPEVYVQTGGSRTECDTLWCEGGYTASMKEDLSAVVCGGEGQLVISGLEGQDHLTVGEEYYNEIPNPTSSSASETAITVEQLSHSLERQPDGTFVLPITQRDSQYEEESIYLIPIGRGKLALKVRFTEKQPPHVTPKNLFGQMSGPYGFYSGAGAWGTVLNVAENGRFTGQYSDTDMGGGPGGIRYFCDFTGKLTQPRQVGDDVFSARVEELTYDQVDVVTYEDGMRCVTAPPAGLEKAEEVLIYQPGFPWEKLPDYVQDWLRGPLSSGAEVPVRLPCFVLYSEADDGVFFAAPKVLTEQDVLNEQDVTILKEEKKKLVLSIPCGQLKEEEWTAQDQLRPEVMVWRDDSTMIWLQTVFLPREGSEDLVFHFGFGHALELSGTMVTSRYSKKLGWQSGIEPWIADLRIGEQTFPEAVRVVPNQVNTDFELSIPLEIVQKADEENMKVELTLNQITYQAQ